MTDAKPNAIEMLKLPQDAFMLEVSRVVSPKPWNHDEWSYDELVHHEMPHDDCQLCGYPLLAPDDPAYIEECPVPPRLEQPPEWWAFKLSRSVPASKNIAWRAEQLLYRIIGECGQHVNKCSATHWFAFEATPQEQIAVCLVALGHWRIEK